MKTQKYSTKTLARLQECKRIRKMLDKLLDKLLKDARTKRQIANINNFEWFLSQGASK